MRAGRPGGRKEGSNRKPVRASLLAAGASLFLILCAVSSTYGADGGWQPPREPAGQAPAQEPPATGP